MVATVTKTVDPALGTRGETEAQLGALGDIT